MIKTLLIKFIYMLRIQIKQNIKRENFGLEELNDPKAFIEYLNNKQNIYKNIEEYNPTRKCNALIAFDNMIPDMISNKKLNQTVTGLLIRGRKLNISILF